MRHVQTQSDETVTGNVDSDAFRFGELVAAMQQALGIRQAEVARLAGCSASHLSNILHARSAPPTEDLARRLASALSLDGRATRRFVAEANLARSRWHAKRIRPRGPGHGAEQGSTAPLDSLDSAGTHVASAAHCERLELMDDGRRGELQSLPGRCEVALDPSPGDGATPSQRVYVEVSLPRIGPARLEIDVSSRGAECLLVLRVLPNTARERRYPP